MKDRERIEREARDALLSIERDGYQVEYGHCAFTAMMQAVAALVLRERAAVWEKARHVLERVDPRFPIPDGGYGIDWSAAIEDAIKELTALAAQERDQ